MDRRPSEEASTPSAAMVRWLPATVSFLCLIFSQPSSAAWDYTCPTNVVQCQVAPIGAYTGNGYPLGVVFSCPNTDSCTVSATTADVTCFTSQWVILQPGQSLCATTQPPPPATEKNLGEPQCGAGNPCNPANGNKYQPESDYAGGEGVPTVARYYNSRLVSKDYGLGYGWTWMAIKKLELNANSLQIREGDGRGEPFTKNGSGQWVGDADSKLTITQYGVGAGAWDYTCPASVVQCQVAPIGSYNSYPPGVVFSCPDLNSCTVAATTYNTTCFTAQWVILQPGQSLCATTQAQLLPPTTYTLSRQDGSVEHYDANGRLVSETDRNNRITSYGYNGAGQLTSVTGPFGHTLAVGYDGNGRISSITDPAGGVYSYSYDVSGNLSRVTYPDGTFRVYHYENASFPHHLTGITDERGVRFATYAYDANGKAIRTEHAITTNTTPQERFSFTYNSDTQTTVTDPIGNQEVMTFASNLGVKNLTNKLNQGDGKALTQTFDAQNNLTCKKDEEGRVTTYTYNAANQRLTQTEGQSGDCSTPVASSVTRTTTYQYLSSSLALPTVIESPSVAGGQTKKTEVTYTNNLPTTITQRGYTPSGNSISRTINLQYDSQGRVTSIDGPRTDTSDITTLEYNNCTSGSACGQLKTITNALGQVTTFNSYDAGGRLTEQTDTNGLKTSYSYDLRSRVLSVTHTPQGGSPRITQYSYDQRGNVTQTIQPDGRTLTYTYDAANYLTQVTDNLGNKVEYSYDLKGNRTGSLTKDPDGSLVRNIQTAYDLRNRLSQINHAGSLTNQVFDALGNLTATQDPNGNATAHQYDSLNRLLQTVDALSGATLYGYDKNDKLTQVTAPNGAGTQYEHDDLGNQLKEVSPDRGTLTYTHDEAGNTKSITDARNVTAQYSYDALNRVTGIDYPGTDEDIALVYDSYTGCTNGTGRLCQVTDQSGITEYAYDSFGNVSQVTRTELGVTYVTRYTYDTANRVSSIAYPDGRAVSYSRDAVGRINGVGMTVSGNTAALTSNVAYRADGLPKSITYGNGLTESRLYNLKGELTGQTLGSENHNYTYDLNGNLTQTVRASGTSLYGYDALDRLINETSASVGSLGYSYDANGNRLALLDNGATASYAYGPASNRLTQVATQAVTLDPAGNLATQGSRSFGYLGSGRLQTVVDAGVAVATYSYDRRGLRTGKTAGGQTTVYHYDEDGRLLLETTSTGTPIRAYVWLGDRPLVQVEASDTVFYLHTDHLGTPRLATNGQGTTVWTWEGSAHGATAPTGSATVNLRYAGQYYDSETGLHYNWHRYYDPRTGRYLTSDLVGLAGGLNTYSYVFNNPLRYTDPKGLFLGSGLGRVLGRLLGRTPEEAAYGGKILDVGVGAVASDVPNCIGGVDVGIPRDLLRGAGGAQAIGLSTATTYGLYGAGATIGSATASVALPVALAGYGGYETGSAFNNLYERYRGNSLGSDIHDLVNEGRLFNNPTQQRCGCSN